MDEEEFKKLVEKEKKKPMVWDEELGCWIYNLTPRRRMPRVIPVSFTIVEIEKTNVPSKSKDFNDLLQDWFDYYDPKKLGRKNKKKKKGEKDA